MRKHLQTCDLGKLSRTGMITTNEHEQSWRTLAVSKVASLMSDPPMGVRASLQAELSHAIRCHAVPPEVPGLGIDVNTVSS